MRELWNFSAGPAQIPLEVLEKIQTEFLSYQGQKMSIVEMSHRSDIFLNLMAETQEKLINIMGIPEDYAVLFLQGGASLQFAMVPMNLQKNGKVGFIHTGNWSKKAMEEAQKIGMQVDIIASSEDKNFTYIPSWPNNLAAYDYLHITSNNTLEGTCFSHFPEIADIPLVADMSSNILSEPLDVSKFDLIYAGAQKNLGIAGLTLVIIRKDLIQTKANIPNILSYRSHYENNSVYHTPPTFAIYCLKLILDWIEAQGGIEEIAVINRKKAQLLYDYLDQSETFSPIVVTKSDRSIMNIPFKTANTDLDNEFIQYCQANNIVNIKGHRQVGGMRASIYNAMPIDGVGALIKVMQAFEEEKRG